MEIPLGKQPESPEERKFLIGELIREQEELLSQSIGHIQRLTIENLIDRGYTMSDLELNKYYEVLVSETEKFFTSVDVLVVLDGKTVMAIKCTPASIDSWQRFMLAFCRVVEPYQIPFAFITDSIEGRLMKVLTGEVIETMEIPTKEELLNLLPSLNFLPYDGKKIHKERRILYAFDAIKCCPPQIK